MKYTTNDFVDILKDCDYPSALIPKIAKDLTGLGEEAAAVFETWARTRVLKDDAFDISGITPKTVREKKEKMTDIAIILLYDHLVKHVRREFDFLLGAKEREAKKTELERNMAKAIFAAAKAQKRTPQ